MLKSLRKSLLKVNLQLVTNSFPFFPILLAGIVLLTISSGVTVSVPYFIGRILDTIFPDESKDIGRKGPFDSILPQFTDRFQKDTCGRPKSETTAEEWSARKGSALVQRLGNVCLILVGVFVLGAAANFGRAYLMTTAGEILEFVSKHFLLSVVTSVCSFVCLCLWKPYLCQEAVELKRPMALESSSRF